MKAINTMRDVNLKALVAAKGDPTQGFEDMNQAAQDGLEDLPWDGPSFEEWQKTSSIPVSRKPRPQP